MRSRISRPGMGGVGCPMIFVVRSSLKSRGYQSTNALDLHRVTHLLTRTNILTRYTRSLPLSRPVLLILRDARYVPQSPKRKYVSNPLFVRKQHNQTVQATSPATCRWHAPFQNLEIAFI